jgi:hypothetical protein
LVAAEGPVRFEGFENGSVSNDRSELSNQIDFRRQRTPFRDALIPHTRAYVTRDGDRESRIGTSLKPSREFIEPLAFVVGEARPSLSRPRTAASIFAVPHSMDDSLSAGARTLRVPRVVHERCCLQNTNGRKTDRRSSLTVDNARQPLCATGVRPSVTHGDLSRRG